MPASAAAPLFSFTLLDDCTSSASVPTSRLYTDFAVERRCEDPSTLDAMWQTVECDIASGLHAVLLADYDWGGRLIGMPAMSDDVLVGHGALRVLLYRQMTRLGADDVEQWLQAHDGHGSPSPAGFTALESSVTRESFESSIESIHDYLRAGETYQVNFTYRLDGAAFGSPIALYRRLRARQPVQFGALIALPQPKHGDAHATEWVLSCSPELFARSDAGQISTRPMKGTAPRATDPAVDRRNADWLANDEKNRAENLMIVDLLRNDLGRIAQVGTVEVPRLFEIESYRTVHQMTSTVQARLLPEVTFPQVLRALFPCGSITGAPKHHTMALISALECSPRRLYTGAIGWIDRPQRPARVCGDFCMSVAIRTILLGSSRQGMRPAQLGVGGGIVLDSTPAAEFEETLVKARFVTDLDPGFTLFETMRASSKRGVRHLDAHLRRLSNSARELGFACDVSALRALLDEAIGKLEPDGTFRLRLDLAHDGTPSLRVAPLGPISVPPARYVVADDPLPDDERALVAYKTSWRRTYDAAIRRAESVGAFDALFFNRRGELTEGARTNVFVRLDGRWWTPPLECGLLPGTMRERLLRRWKVAHERIITRDDLSRAEAVVLCNALRGVVRATPVCMPRVRQSTAAAVHGN